MKQKKNNLVSIIIVNFNNAKYLSKSLNSALNQNYKFKEIIVVDDMSTDNSVEILKKYKKKIKIITNKKKMLIGSYDQINSYYQGYLKSKGKYLFFLDSDDYFKKDKLKILIKEFELTKSNILFDLPIFKFKDQILKKKFKQKKFIISNWPRFSPQSCISVKKNYAEEFFKILKIKKFNTVWFDFRLAIYSFLKYGDIKVIKKYLTYYRQLDNSASKKYKTFSKSWWHRRKEAHEYLSFVSKKLNKKEKISIDKVLTKIINEFF